jgi:hypothetical protein
MCGVRLLLGLVFFFLSFELLFVALINFFVRLFVFFKGANIDVLEFAVGNTII